MFIYNISLFIIFMTLFQFVSFETKTLYSLSDFGANNIMSKVLSISLFSMAGVPPFWGFFSKVLIFLLLCNSNFFILFFFFFTLVFLGLYFYIQNIRFLNSTGLSNYNPIHEKGLRTVPMYFYFIFTSLFFLIFGFVFMEDLFLYFYWLIY